MKFNFFTIISTFFLMVITTISTAAHLGDHLLFSARLNGDQTVPMVDTDAEGVAGFTLDENRGQLCVNVAVNGLSGPITAAHIHSGAMGETGDAIIDLSEGIVNNQINLTITGADLTSTQLAAMLSGDTYINIHTDANPDGEIRGQVKLETDWSFEAKADGDQTVPLVMTDAIGLGVFNLTSDQSTVSYQFLAEGLSGPITAAHLHSGAVGEAGDVIQNLSDDIDGNMIAGNFVPTPDLLIDLMNGEVYLNIHTDENPSGEIRAQLERHTLALDATIDAEQAVPVSLSEANGLSTMWMNNTLDTMWYDVLTQNMSGAITAAHFHEGDPGEAGDAVYNVSDDIDGNRITGMITGADLTNELINQFLRGEVYLNLHSDLFPEGEIRGQVYRLAREGYTTLIHGGNEVPEVSGEGYGAGIVSVDRDQSNVHFMFVVGNLTGPITGAHFHNAAEGENGDVIYNLTPFFSGVGTNDGAYGYWTTDDMMPFGLEASEMFRAEEVYLNVHTDMEADGEIRGQLDRGHTCYNLLSIDETQKGISFDMNVYPNPFNESITVQLGGTPQQTDEYWLELVDLSGRAIQHSTQKLSNGSLLLTPTNLNPGVYVVLVHNGAKVVSYQKVTKL